MHEKHILAKPSALINSQHKLSALQIRILNALLFLASEAQRSGAIDLFEEGNTHFHFCCHTKDVMSVLGKKTNYSFYKDTIRNLQYEFLLNIRNTDKSKRTKELISQLGEGENDSKITSIFKSILVDDLGKITINLNYRQAKWLLEPAPFAKVNIRKEAPLVHRASVLLYEMFEDIFRSEYKLESGRNSIEVSVSELKKLLGLKSDYKYFNMKKLHILPALSEIEDKVEGLNVSFKEIYNNEIIRGGELVSHGNRIEYLKLTYEYQQEIRKLSKTGLLINIDIPQEMYLVINKFPEKVRGGLISALRNTNYLLYDKKEVLGKLIHVYNLYNKGIAKSPVGLIIKLIKNEMSPTTVDPDNFKDKFSFYRHFKKAILAPAINRLAKTNDWSAADLKDLYDNLGVSLRITDGYNKLYLDFRHINLKEWAMFESFDISLGSMQKYFSGFDIDLSNSYYKEEFRQNNKDKFNSGKLRDIEGVFNEDAALKEISYELLDLKDLVKEEKNGLKLDKATIFETYLYNHKLSTTVSPVTSKHNTSTPSSLLDDYIPY